MLLCLGGLINIAQRLNKLRMDRLLDRYLSTVEQQFGSRSRTTSLNNLSTTIQYPTVQNILSQNNSEVTLNNLILSRTKQMRKIHL